MTMNNQNSDVVARNNLKSVKIQLGHHVMAAFGEGFSLDKSGRKHFEQRLRDLIDMGCFDDLLREKCPDILTESEERRIWKR